MSITITAGRNGVSVTSGAEVNLLTSAGLTAQTGIDKVRSWGLVVTTDQTITVRTYKRFGANAGEKLLRSDTVTSAAPFILERDVGECALAIRVTAQASSTTATVSADFRGVGGE